MNELPPEHDKEKRHGSPIFYALLDDMAETHNSKSHDYASNDNPFGNYHFAGQVSTLFAHSPEDAGFAGRIAEKIFRLANLESSNKTPSNESIEDTEKDIAVITVLWMADRRNRRMSNQIKGSAKIPLPNRHSTDYPLMKSTQQTDRRGPDLP